MSDLLIKNVELPPLNKQFLLCVSSDGTVYSSVIGSLSFAETKATLIPPHGRLGDLDKLESGLRHMAKYQHGERQQGILGCCETIRLAPTIIPASE